MSPALSIIGSSLSGFASRVASGFKGLRWGRKPARAETVETTDTETATKEAPVTRLKGRVLDSAFSDSIQQNKEPRKRASALFKYATKLHKQEDETAEAKKRVEKKEEVGIKLSLKAAQRLFVQLSKDGARHDLFLLRNAAKSAAMARCSYQAANIFAQAIECETGKTEKADLEAIYEDLAIIKNAVDDAADLIEKGQHEQAVSMLELFEKECQNDLTYLQRYQQALHGNGNSKKAAAISRKIISLSVAQANCFIQDGNYAEALGILGPLEEQCQSSDIYLDLYHQALKGAGNAQKASEVLERRLLLTAEQIPEADGASLFDGILDENALAYVQSQVDSELASSDETAEGDARASLPFPTPNKQDNPWDGAVTVAEFTTPAIPGAVDDDEVIDMLGKTDGDSTLLDFLKEKGADLEPIGSTAAAVTAETKAKPTLA